MPQRQWLLRSLQFLEAHLHRSVPIDETLVHRDRQMPKRVGIVNGSKSIGRAAHNVVRSTYRPHSALQGRTPLEVLQQWKAALPHPPALIGTGPVKGVTSKGAKECKVPASEGEAIEQLGGVRCLEFNHVTIDSLAMNIEDGLFSETCHG